MIFISLAGKSSFLNSLILSLSILIFLVSFYELSIVYASETITIVPGASDSSRYRFFDMIEYPIGIGKEVKWYNADNIVHNIVISSADGEKIISETVKPKQFFSYTFNKEGEYTFQSSDYEWMKGKIIVTNNMKTIKKSLKNDIDVYLTWTPSSIEVGGNVFFKIIFVNKYDTNNVAHIDYSFSIEDPESDKVLYQSALTHSAWGVESSSYTFNSPGTFMGKIGIEGVLFQPVVPDNVTFEIQVR